jgi:hypothetical protein
MHDEYDKWISTIINEIDQYIDLIGWDMYDYFTLEETYRYKEDAIQYNSLLLNNGDKIADELIIIPEFNIRGGPPTAGEYYDTYYESLYVFSAFSNGYNNGIWQMNYYSLIDDILMNRNKGLFTSEITNNYNGIYSLLHSKMRKPVSYVMEVIGNITNPNFNNEALPSLLNGFKDGDQIDYLASIDSSDTIRIAISNRFEGKTKLNLLLDGFNINNTIKIWKVEDFTIAPLPIEFVDIISKNHIQFELEPFRIYYFCFKVNSTIEPEIKIINPGNYIYIDNQQLIPFFKPLIFGNINIKTYVSEDINSVEFYIDDILKDIDTEEPYEFIWDDISFFKHKIRVIAENNKGKKAEDEILIWKFF